MLYHLVYVVCVILLETSNYLSSSCLLIITNRLEFIKCQRANLIAADDIQVIPVISSRRTSKLLFNINSNILMDVVEEEDHAHVDENVIIGALEEIEFSWN